MKKNKSFIVFLIISVITAVFGFLVKPGDELIYTIMAQYLLLPLFIFIFSIISVKNGTLMSFICPVIYVLIAVLLPFITLGKTDIAFLAFAGAPAIAGVLIGCVILAVKSIKKAKKEKEFEKKGVPLHA